MEKKLQNEQSSSSFMFSSQPSFLVWFLLLDSNSGEPFKGAGVDYISFPSAANFFVAQFRDAVYDKNSSILNGIASSQLNVYKNKSAFIEGPEKALKPSCLFNDLGGSAEEENLLVVAVPTSRNSTPSTSESSLQSLMNEFSSLVSKYTNSLEQIGIEIKELENREDYQNLSKKNRPWVFPKPTDQEKGEWQLLQEKLAELKKKEDFYQNAILSLNANLAKKSDHIRKGYKKDTAIKDERLLLSDVAIKMWNRFRFQCVNENKPTFGDLKRAAGFKGDGDVREYFRKRAKGEVKKDVIKEALNESQWIFLIGLNQRVNSLLHDTLIVNQDGSLRLVLEHDVYEDGAGLAKEVVSILYGPKKKLDLKDAASDSSNSP